MTGFHLSSLWSSWRLWRQRFEAWRFKAKGHFGTWYSYKMLFESTQSGEQPGFGRVQTQTPIKKALIRCYFWKDWDYFSFLKKMISSIKVQNSFFLRSLLLNRTNSSSTDRRLSCHDASQNALLKWSWFLKKSQSVHLSRERHSYALLCSYLQKKSKLYGCTSKVHRMEDLIMVF